MAPRGVKLAALAALVGLATAACARAAVPGRSGDRDPEGPIVPEGQIVDVLPKDQIPSIDDPQFISPADAAQWLAGREPVVALELNGEARAYPVQIMTWHEIVNDEVGGHPVTVTYCPLCNSAIAYDPRAKGRVLEFGTSGKLFQSALVMYDRQTDSLWTHFDGRAVDGPLTGTTLELIPVQMLSFDQWRERFPDGTVLSRETGEVRSYGQNPYVGYDDQQGPSQSFFQGPIDDRLPAMARVVGIRAANDQVAYPYSSLARGAGVGVMNDEVDGRPVAVLWEAGVASALDEREIKQGQDVGTSGAFAAETDGRRLTFAIRGTQIQDEETGSAWDVTGRAVSGPLEGTQLEPLVHVDTFWFAWQAYNPDTRIVE